MVPIRECRVVVIAASAGGIQALQRLVACLPPDVPAALLVVLHVPATGGRVLPKILTRAGSLAAAAAVDGEELRPGRVYVAPPDTHLLVVDDVVRLSRGPQQNGHRPAADPLFRSAALTVGPRAIAVVLSGTLDDGALGSASIERQGGLVAIQDPSESVYDGMPRAAIAATMRPAILSVTRIAKLIDEQSRAPVAAPDVPPDPELERYVALFLNPVT
jgi:two-component system, chemotaxis family, protein-glutamate methylesterase/glutaminase